MPNTVKRLNYYDHQFLRAPDFTDEQNYHLSMRRLHNNLLHTWGIAQGLQVAVATGGTGTAVTVSAGVGIDSTGRELVLASATNLELGGEAAGTTLYITLAYDEQQSDPTTEAGGPGNTRITEAPKLSFSKTAPPGDGMTLILAKVPRTATGLGTVDPSDRKQAGVVLGNDLTVNTLTLKKDGVAQANWPVLSCSAANQAALANAGLFVNGNVGVGTATPKEKLHVEAGSIYANGENNGVIVDAQGSERTGLMKYPGKETMLVGDSQLASPVRLGRFTGGSIKAPTTTTDDLVINSSGNVGIGTTTPTIAKLEVDGMVGNTVGLFGKTLGMSLVASWPNLGFNGYFNGSWKAISPGWAGVIGVDQNDGSMNFFTIPAKATAADAVLPIANRLAIHADGKVVSPMWRVTQVMNQVQGALPKGGNFTSGGGLLVILFSGSGYRTTGGTIGINLFIDNVERGINRSFTNEVSSHKTFVPAFIVLAGIAAGTHTVTLNAFPPTVTDGNDYFSVTVLELPF